MSSLAHAFATSVISVLGVIAFLACSPRPVTPHPEDDLDAGDYPTPPDNLVDEHPEGSPLALASPCGRACENLRAIPCREGFPTPQGVTCYRGCLSMARHQRIPTSCWASQKAAADVRACGGLRCLPP